ncbi:MAG: FkbM family methyltransferase [Candidatus Dependentiae bacterium]|nr:FkbM family methyltransferase [Candidatus Dependentiae bacterium]
MKALFAIIFLCTIFFVQTELHSISYNLVISEQNIEITPSTEKIGHTWTNGTVWDKPLIQKFYSLLKQAESDIVVFDIGAQTGCFSLLAKYFPHSTWYAFEPIQEAVTALQDNLKLNNINNVTALQTAVSDFSGTITLKMPAMNAWGLSTIGANPLRFDTVSEREVPCIDIDSFVRDNNIKKVDFIKIDTEGAELYILRGAKEMIFRDRPVILMEYNKTNMQQCNVTKEEIHHFLIEMGYTWEQVSSDDILCIPQ